ncbi:glycosyltransferase involved in cell wall biosynthesis [Paraburkholderia sp. BL6665CI2N2]|uniref:glycosyltransferase family 4 protein n=1 Tax=Paraburkholderia sp. BL6665CI2N2 TaxID=1938806 RepID=UPI001065B24F|nr:glycosyltransferase family 4 protein [Paraburkholderia sp. BL6665CI2N2]TDY17035.1 glycosyltransferase involved in cell wall biosynthesis [Paraburkholderia sp. BL6665CI2N2]
MSTSLAIVMIHQGSELYGSDRSFVSALCALRERHPDAVIDVVLPEAGPIVDHVVGYASRIIYNSNGVLRKKELKARPWQTCRRMIEAWLGYRSMFPSYQICYVNTVVCVAAIAALRGQRAGAYVHVREIPSSLACRVFRALLRFSRAGLIYNSHATAAAFALPGDVIHNGVDVAGPIAVADAPQNRTKRLAIIGRINPWKGQQFVLDALSMLGRALPVHVRIVGDVFPGYEGLLVSLRETAKTCTQSVEIEGFTSDPGAHFAWADFLVVPSVQPEPFGRVAIESFAYGRPVIAAATGGLQEIVTDGVNGFLFAPGDMRDFLRVVSRALAMTHDAYADMANAAREKYLSAFTVKTYMRSVADTVQPLLDDSRRAHEVSALQRETR